MASFLAQWHSSLAIDVFHCNHNKHICYIPLLFHCFPHLFILPSCSLSLPLALYHPACLHNCPQYSFFKLCITLCWYHGFVTGSAQDLNKCSLLSLQTSSTCQLPITMPHISEYPCPLSHLGHA